MGNKKNTEVEQHGSFAAVKVGGPFLALVLHVSDPMGIDAEYMRATSVAGFPTIVGATYAHCIDERIPALSGYGSFCASVGADALYGAREVR